MTENTYRQELERAIREKEQAIRSLEHDIRVLEGQIRSLDQQMRSSGVSSSRMDSLMRNLEVLKRDLQEARHELQVIRQIQNQIERTLAMWKQTINENVQLENELNVAVLDVQTLNNACREMDSAVNERMQILSQAVVKAEIDTKHVFDALSELTFWYISFKNVSSASKYITQYTDEYHTKFSYYNELRRITIGYVIGLDKMIISSEVMRKKVEEAYLQNSEYWLAYCIAAVMLWSNNEKEAAQRALSKSLQMNYYNACLFYLLINLRFGRVDAAMQWYLVFFDRVDTNRLGDEWQYLLQAYLCGAFGSDQTFQEVISDNFRKMLTQAGTKTVDFHEKVIAHSKNFADLFLHKTNREFNTLKKTCAEYDDIIELLSCAEKNGKLAMYYDSIAETNPEASEELSQRIENVLYSLISNYDSDELKLVKKIKYNEAIVSAKGDLNAALANYNLAYEDEKKQKNLLDLLLKWAFSYEDAQTNIVVVQFAISFLKDWIIKGIEKSIEEYQEKEKEKYTIKIDTFTAECREDEFLTAKGSLEKHYDKKRFVSKTKDKQVRIYSGICLLSIVLLIVLALFFSPVILTLAILIGITGSFLLWRRLVDVGNILKAKKRKGVLRLKKSLDELKAWRKAYNDEHEKKTDLFYAINRFQN